MVVGDSVSPLFTYIVSGLTLDSTMIQLRERLSLGPHPCLELYLSFLVSTGLMRYVPQAWIEIGRF